MKISDAKKLTLFKIATNQLGYEVFKKKDCASWRALKQKEMGYTILVRSQPNANGEYFFLNTLGGGGNIFNLLQLHGIRFNDFFGNISWDCPKPKSSYAPSKILPSPNSKKLWEKCPLAVHVSENYLSSRKISVEVQRLFNLRVMPSGNAIFFLFRIGDLKLQTHVQFSNSGKYFAKGSRLDAIWGKRVGEPKKDLICESPIDALSYFELFKPQNILLLATCGAMPRKVKEQLPAFLVDRGIEELILAFDDDEAGKRMSNGLGFIFEQEKISHSLFPWKDFPGSVDLNDVLKKKTFL